MTMQDQHVAVIAPAIPISEQTPNAPGPTVEVSSSERVHLVAARTAADLTELAHDLRRRHEFDLNEQVGFGTMIALEKAIYALDQAAHMTRPELPPVPTAGERPIEYHVFSTDGTTRTFIQSFGSDQPEASRAAATWTELSRDALRFVVEAVEV